MERNTVFKFKRGHTINIVIVMFFAITGCFSRHVVSITPQPISKATHKMPYSVFIEFDEVKDEDIQGWKIKLDTENLRYSFGKFIEERGTFSKVETSRNNNQANFTLNAHLKLFVRYGFKEFNCLATVDTQLLDYTGKILGVYQQSAIANVTYNNVMTNVNKSNKDWFDMYVYQTNVAINTAYEKICKQMEQDYAQGKIVPSIEPITK